MKLFRSYVPKDLCHDSLSMLSEKATTYLRAHGLKNIWIPDDERRFLNSHETVDVLLFGGFLERFIESGIWPDSNYRLWAFSNASKKVLTNMFGFNDAEIGLIPRSELFPEKAPMPIPASGIDFVFAGRISSTKNIECILRTFSILQNQFSSRLHFFGEFDDMTDPDRGRFESTSFKGHIDYVVKNLPWREEPYFHGKVEKTEWLHLVKNPVLINFSTFIFEDFGVSLAQAQEQGWPSIVTSWGGFRDQVLDNCLQIPWQMIGRSDESIEIKKIKSKRVAAYISSYFGNSKKSVNSRGPASSSMPEAVGTARLDKLRREFLKTLGPQSYLIQKESLAAFADTTAGARFFSKYRMLFGSSNFSKAHVIVTNDLNVREDAFNQNIRQRTLDIERSLPREQEVIFISARELTLPENLEILSQCQKVHLTFDHPSLDLPRIQEMVGREF